MSVPSVHHLETVLSEYPVMSDASFGEITSLYSERYSSRNPRSRARIKYSCYPYNQCGLPGRFRSILFLYTSPRRPRRIRYTFYRRIQDVRKGNQAFAKAPRFLFLQRGDTFLIFPNVFSFFHRFVEISTELTSRLYYTKIKKARRFPNENSFF